MTHSGQTVHVIGAGGHGKVVIRTLQEMGYTVTAIFDDAPQTHGTTLFGVPVEGSTARLADLGKITAVIAIGDNAQRRRIAESFELDWLQVIHPSAVVDRTVRLGCGVTIMAGAVVQADALLGDHVIVNTSASVDHDCRIGDYVHIAPGARLAGAVSVGEGALLGVGSVVLPGKAIGRWSVVGAAAAVTRDLPDGVVAMGSPAKPIRKMIPAPPTSDQASQATLRRESNSQPRTSS